MLDEYLYSLVDIGKSVTKSVAYLSLRLLPCLMSDYFVRVVSWAGMMPFQMAQAKTDRRCAAQTRVDRCVGTLVEDTVHFITVIIALEIGLI